MNVFSIGLSGLEAAQTAINTTGNNVSNVATPGYTEEVTQLADAPDGDGVTVTGVQRQVNPFITAELNASQSQSSSLTTHQNQIQQVDQLFSSSSASLATGLQGFFSAVSQYAQSPSTAAARQGVIGAANSLATEFQAAGQTLNSMAGSLNGQIGASVKQINTLSSQIASLNQQITTSEGSNPQPPNALLDQRDELVSQLSQQVGITTVQQSDGSYTVALGNGQPLVAGSKGFALTTLPAASNGSTAIGYANAAGVAVELPDSDVTGGALGGLIQFRDQSLQPTQGQLGALAVGFAEAINQAQAAGFTSAGTAGGPMFATGTPMVLANTDNTGTASLSGTYDPATAGALTGDDYALTYNGTGFNVTDLDTGATSTASIAAGNTVSLAGTTLTISNPADLASGDSFELQSTREGASNFATLITSPSSLAPASASGGSGNNQAALALENIQNQNVIGGSATPAQAYAALVSQVGNQASGVATDLTTQQAITQQLTQDQQSYSGVNLDQEAMNLSLYQQYYEADTKVIAAGQAVLQTLLQLNP
ncbi:MAG TPA: flagellar hook-associated protein FlgK [Nevskiaceae bacterium]|nr:flagellar hook-associated protein FlgK [Nevskiaceae bacterium]